MYFIKQFVSEEILFQYLSAADIYLAPYINQAQITSGTLSYAIGAGAAVVSTPYWHAKELLSQGIGELFDFKDSDQLADILNDLLDHPAKLNKLKARALDYGKHLKWSLIGKQYLKLCNEAVEKYSPQVQGKTTFIDPALIPAELFEPHRKPVLVPDVILFSPSLPRCQKHGRLSFSRNLDLSKLMDSFLLG